jgi:hypothetical protein
MKTPARTTLASSLAVALTTLLISAYAHAADKLIVKDGASVTKFVVTDTGATGVGTATPAKMLHVSTSGATNSTLRFQSAASAWDFNNNAVTGRLTFTDDPAGVRVPFKFGVNGVDNLFRVGVLATNTVDINGNLTVTGTFSNPSSRQVKDLLASADGLSILAKLSTLPLFTWSYKNSDGVRHFGPVAEDFYARFSLGLDEKHISPNDMAGVALAATQALNALLSEKDAAKDAEIRALRERLIRLESRLGLAPKAKAAR